MATASGDVVVGIFIPAFSYQAPISYQAIVKAALEDFGLEADGCEFLKPDNDKIACMLKNSKFTLEYIEQTYKHNQSLSQRLESAADALLTFQEKIADDELTIDNLKAQLMAVRDDEASWKKKYEEEATLRRALQEKLEKLKYVVNSDTILQNFGTESSKPKIPIPKLALQSMNGIPPSPHSNGTICTPIPPLNMNGLSLHNHNTPSPPPIPTLNMNGLSLHNTPIPSSLPPSIPTLTIPPPSIPTLNMNGLAPHNPPTPPSIPSLNMNGLAFHANPPPPSIPSLNMNGLATHNNPHPPSSLHPSSYAEPPPPPRGGEFRSGIGLVTSPREFRLPTSSSSSLSSSSSSVSPMDASAQMLRSLVSPRDAAILQQYALSSSQGPPPTINGKRSSSEIGLMGLGSMTSPRKQYDASTTSPRKQYVDASPRSPRGIGKAHTRRHSSSLDEGGGTPLRRSSGSSASSSDVGTPRSSPSPRSRSSSDFPFDCHQLIDVHLMHAFNYQAILDNPGKRRTITLKPSKSEMELSLDALGQCRVCSCDTFRGDGKADWICLCGHTNIKHSLSYMKASPSPSPTVSPRKFG